MAASLSARLFKQFGIAKLNTTNYHPCAKHSLNVASSNLVALRQFSLVNYAANNLQKSFFSTTSGAFKSFKIPLPALSPTMESGTIVSWEKKEGDRLNDGDLLAEIETDKATMGFETPEEGYLAKVVVQAGTKNVPLGKILCVIVDNEAEIAEFKDYTGEGDSSATISSQEAPTPAAAAPTSSTPPPPPPPAPVAQQPFAQFSNPPAPPQPHPAADVGRSFASPLAKKLARESNVALPQVGSGPKGRVVANDLAQLLAAGSAASGAASQQQQHFDISSQILSSASDFTDIPLTNMRQTIAKRLTQSKQSIPHYYLTVSLNVDELLKLRETANKLLAKEDIKLSVNDFIVKAASLACKQVPEVNSQWNETFIRQYNKVDVSVAVSTDAGLITPIIFNADSKGLKQIGVESKGLAAKARASKLQPAEYQGGTFTISNLGMFNIQHFTAVINPPQSAILAVGTSQKTVVPVDGEEQQFKVVNTLNVTLSCDHRVVDGAVGAKWLGVFRQLMEKPFTMLL